MKKTFIFLFAIALLSCSSSKTIRQSKKVIKGDWILNSVSYDSYVTHKVTLLNDVTKDCFEGSTWSFVPNNNRATYTINNSTCSSGNRNFIFVVQEIDAQTGLYDFLLKPTNEKYKSETNKGFRLKLASLSDSEMNWEQITSIDGKSFTIKMNFKKNNN